MVRDLRKSYGGRPVLQGIDLDVAAGELVAVLGPNGAGKTTTVEILEGLTTRDDGTVEVLGHDPGRPGADFRHRIGVVLQHGGVEPMLTCRELLDLHRSFYRRSRPTTELLDLVGLVDQADQLVRTLSGGQQRRVDVALALAGDPELVFLDEPTTGFDPAARQQAWAAISELRALGKTIVLTTHYLDEAEALADRIVVVANGRVVAEGPPGALGDRHRAASRISFAAPAGLDPSRSTVTIDVQGGRWTVATTDVTAGLHALTGWALAAGVELHGLTVAPPSLEEIYLEVTA